MFLSTRKYSESSLLNMQLGFSLGYEAMWAMHGKIVCKILQVSTLSKQIEALT